jgi:hypothetical protein
MAPKNEDQTQSRAAVQIEAGASRYVAPIVKEEAPLTSVTGSSKTTND